MTSVATHPGPSRGWAVVAGQELRDLWLGTRGLLILLVFSVLLSFQSFFVAGDAELNFLDAREAVGGIVRLALSIGTLSALIISADAISGERERGTLEHVLLTPVRRRDLVVGKLIASLTMWFAALAISIPYVAVVAKGPGLAVDAVLVMTIVGTLVATAVTGLGLAVSALSRSNRVSLAVSLVILVALAAPSQLPGSATRGLLGQILVLANPIAAGLRLSSKVVVDQLAWSTQWTLLIAPAMAAVVVTAIAVASWRRVGLGDTQ